MTLGASNPRLIPWRAWAPGAFRALVFLCACLATVQTVSAQRLADLRVGHWVEVRGELRPDGRFQASDLEVMAPGPDEILIGTVRGVDLARGRFSLLGRSVRVSEKTEWRELSLRALEGARVEVEGHWRSGILFSARKIAPRKAGRDRISGRIDEIETTGEGWELLVQGFRVLMPASVAPESKVALADLPLAPEQDRELPGAVRSGQEDFVPGGIRLTENLRFGGLLEYKGRHEDEFDLDESDDEDQDEHRLSLKGQLAFTPSERFHGLLSGRFEALDEREEGDDSDLTGRWRLTEAWGYWSDVATEGFDLQAGRMNFDDAREWLYKRKLDGARLYWSRPGLALELSGTTVIDGGKDRDENSENLIAYLSNNDPRRELALWMVDRRDDRSPRDFPIHFGGRALGSWIPQNEVWAEASLLRGFSDGRNLEGWATDLGTTWSPAFAESLSFTVGWALASGDDPATFGTDEAYRQTGLHRNNGRWAGVTSFRYYGEIVDPELSNLSILTLGLGARPWRRTSIDLVWHGYHQVESVAFLRNSDLEQTPDGAHANLGQEVDLVLGTKVFKGWDFEVVLGRFMPGDAFPGGDDAWLGTVQMRYRF